MLWRCIDNITNRTPYTADLLNNVKLIENGPFPLFYLLFINLFFVSWKYVWNGPHWDSSEYFDVMLLLIFTVSYNQKK